MTIAKFGMGQRIHNKKTNERGTVVEPPIERDGTFYYTVAIDADQYDEPILSSTLGEWPEDDVEFSNKQ